MNQLDRTVAMKRPAAVTTYDARPVILMTAPYHRKANLTAAVARQSRRGEVRPLSAAAAYNKETGLWQIQVLQLRPPAPAWIKPVIIAGVALIALAALLGLGWWMLVSLTAGSLALFLLAGLAILALIARAGRAPTVNVIQNVQVRR
jgi:ABC-type multidrug transport system fused ATPase/permease subunit